MEIRNFLSMEMEKMNKDENKAIYDSRGVHLNDSVGRKVT